MKKIFIISSIIHFLFIMTTILGLIQLVLTLEKEYLLFVISVMGYSISLIIISISFSKYTNLYPMNQLNKNLITEHDLKKDFNIIVQEEGDLFDININERHYAIDLRGYIFKRYFIMALLSRNFRYHVVSGKLPLIYLFKRKLKVYNNSNLNCKVLFYSKSNLKKKVILIKNAYNKNNFLIRCINKSKYYKDFISMTSQQVIRNNIYKINEEIYQLGD